MDHDQTLQALREAQGDLAPIGKTLAGDEAQGRRSWWRLDPVERDLVDVDALIDEMTDLGLTSAKQLWHTQEEEDEGVWMAHDILVGNLDLADGECWALRMECNLVEDANFESQAEVTLLHGRSNIQALLIELGQNALAERARAIADLVGQWGNDPTMLLALKQAIRTEGGEDILAVWDAQATDANMEAHTAPAPGKPKLGRL